MRSVLVALGRSDRNREWRDVPLVFTTGNDLVFSFLVYLVNAYHTVQWNIGTFDACELRLQLFLGWIDDEFRSFAEDNVRHFHECEHPALIYLVSVKLVDVSQVMKNNPKYELEFYTKLYMAQVTELAKSKQIKVIGNIPYNITSQIIFKIIAP